MSMLSISTRDTLDIRRTGWSVITAAPSTRCGVWRCGQLRQLRGVIDVAASSQDVIDIVPSTRDSG